MLRNNLQIFMEKLKSGLYLLILFAFLFSGCVPSLIYSPSVNLPPKPLKKDDVQIMGGFGLFPETQPDRVQKKLASGGEATFRYGFSNNYAMQLKGWYDFSDNVEQERWGLSMGSMIVFNDSLDYRFGIMPNLALAFDDGSIEGGGGYIPFTLWINNYDPFNLYIAAGPVIGLRDINAMKSQWGWGLILNAGGALIINNITLNIEFSAIKQVNEYNGNKNYFFSPSINIGYIF